MAVQRKKLRVLPNPWLYIDEKGQPAGTVRLEQPSDGTFIHGWVGARVAKVTPVEPAKRVTVSGRVFEQKHAIDHLTFNHADEPVTVANTPYYRKRVSCGDLIAFDEETARACGISLRNFAKPETLLAKFKADAIKLFDAENGEGAFETLADMATEEAEIAEAVAKAVADEKGEESLLEGVTLPADGVARTVELEATPALAPLVPIETDASGNAVMVEHEAPALTHDSNSSRSKNSRKGSDQ
jgi:hypothetical protein